jgi:hypothetical protein
VSISLIEYKTVAGTLEFRFDSLEYTSEYDSLVRVLNKIDVHPVEQFDGIWVKRASYVLPSGGRFELVFDEDVGIYVNAIDQTLDVNNELRQLLQRMVAWINQALLRRDSPG